MSSDRRIHKKLTMRKRIRHAVLGLFTADGFNSVTVGRVVDIVSVSPMTFYRHSGTEEAAIVNVILTGSTGQATHREATLVPVAGTSEGVVGVVDSVLDDSIDWIDDLAHRLRLVYDNSRPQDLLWQQTAVWAVILRTLLAGDGLEAHARVRTIVGTGVKACLAWPDREGFPSTLVPHQCLWEAAEALG